MKQYFKKTFFLIIFILIFSIPVLARIGDFEIQSKVRYGDPLEKYALDKISPILSEVPKSFTKTYKYDGWNIRAAYYKGKTIRIQYSKMNGKPILLDEIKAILGAEANGKKWKNYPLTSNILTKIQDSIKYKNKWINENGNVAYIHGGRSILTIDSPLVKQLIQQKNKAKETKRKSNIPKF